MVAEQELRLEKLAGRQKRPATGDLFRVRVIGGDYYFGLVVDGDMKVGPMAPGSILAVVFAGGSESGETDDPDALPGRPLLMPPVVVNQRPWTTGLAQKIGETDRRPDIEYTFDDLAFGTVVDRHGAQIQPPRSRELTGVWGLGNEYTLSKKIVAALAPGKQEPA